MIDNIQDFNLTRNLLQFHGSLIYVQGVSEKKVRAKSSSTTKRRFNAVLIFHHIMSLLIKNP